VLELPSRDEAIAWAARIAKACRCDQELRVFGFDHSPKGDTEMRASAAWPFIQAEAVSRLGLIQR